MGRIELRASYTATGLLIFLGLALAAPALAPVAIGGKLIFIVLGLLVGAWGIALSRRRLTLDDQGVTFKGLLATRSMGWNEVDYYTFWSMDQQMGYAYGGGQAGVAGVIVVAIIAAIVSASRNRGQENRRFAMGRLTLVGQGKKLPIDARFKGVITALDSAFEQLHTRLRAAGRRDYAPFALENGELRHAKKGALGLPDVEKISVAGGQLSVKKRGKRLAWARSHLKNVRNGMLFIEELGEHGLIVDAKAGMFVPPTVLEKLRAATARQAALPAARVVARD